MAGSDRVPDPDDSKASPGWNCANQLTERNGALLGVQAGVLLRNQSTPPTLLAIGVLQQLPPGSCYGDLRCVQMHDLPTFLGFVQDDGSSIEEPWSIVEMKGHNRYALE